jgi:hypothetical protein
MIGAHRTCKCGAVYDRSEHIVEAREISSIGTPLGFLDIDSSPVQLGMPND